MDKRENAQETVTALRAQPVRNRHAGQAAEDLALKLLLQPRLVEAIAP